MLSSRSAAGSWRSPRRAPSVLSLAALLSLVTSCSDHSATAPGIPNVASANLSAQTDEVFSVTPTMIDIPTYDGTGQAVHPDVVLFDTPWNGAKYWLTMTPYALSDQKLENPSILTSDDGMHVSAPVGLTNPVIPAPRNGKNYNSDPELLYEPQTRRLVLFDRFVEKKTNTLEVLTSRDGAIWSRTRSPLRVRAHQAVSPTIAPRVGKPAKMWTVNAGKAGCSAKATRVEMRTAADTAGRFVETTWSKPSAVELSIPGYTIWHIKARWVAEKSEYWMLISAYPNDHDGCKTDDLFFARSTDGLRWKAYATPVLRHQDREWTAAAVYRSTFLYDASTDRMDLWISARGADGVWRMGYARARYASLLTALENNRELTPTPAAAFSVKVKISGEEP
jgi:hypothetical protein